MPPAAINLARTQLRPLSAAQYTLEQPLPKLPGTPALLCNTAPRAACRL